MCHSHPTLHRQKRPKPPLAAPSKLTGIYDSDSDEDDDDDFFGKDEGDRIIARAKQIMRGASVASNGSSSRVASPATAVSTAKPPKSGKNGKKGAVGPSPAEQAAMVKDMPPPGMPHSKHGMGET